MSDNRTFDLKCVGLRLAVDVAMQGNLQRVSHYHETPDRIVFFWTSPGDRWPVSVLPGLGLSVDGVVMLIEAWAETANYGRKPDIDGDCERNFRIYNGPTWSHVEEFGWPSLFAVEPAWAMHGK